MNAPASAIETAPAVAPPRRAAPSSFLHEDEGDDPILSVVNLIDVFLVIIAALLISVIQSPANPFSSADVTVIRNAGKPDMEITVKQGEKITHYQAKGQIGGGDGEKAGVAYRLKDGAMVYVPEAQARAPAVKP
ncbi:DUF2149 domain-containing protein [Niveibacterium terrae]|uniref:DUF2149 domain-containing protein n=1 Tax=Niveibacterium terrae TaxID=3373598 RepID=UPI003A92134E